MRRALSLLILLAAMPPLSGVLAAADPVPRPTSRPMRVMSISQCTDQLLLMLLPPERISSVTWLSRDPRTSLMADQARKVGVNHGLSEEVLRDRPDLVIAGSFTTTATRQMLRHLGWPMLEVAPAETIAQVREMTRRIGRAVDQPARAEALLAHMDRGLAELARHPGPPLRVAAWDGGGFSAARGSLYDTVLTAAGAVNVAADPAVVRSGVPDAELLIATAPALLIRGGAYDRDDLRANAAQHPVVRRFWGGGRSLAIRQSYYICGTPLIADEAIHLRRELRAAAVTARAPLPFARRAAR